MDITRRSRTCAPKTRAAHQPVENRLRLLSKVLREVATSHRFASYADLKDAFRRRLIALAIQYPQRTFDEAFTVVGSNTHLVQRRRFAGPVRRERIDIERGLSRAEAGAWMAQLPGAVRAMPRAFGASR